MAYKKDYLESTNFIDTQVFSVVLLIAMDTCIFSTSRMNLHVEKMDVENHASLEFLLYHSQHTNQQENRHHHSQNSYQIWGIYQIF